MAGLRCQQQKKGNMALREKKEEESKEAERKNHAGKFLEGRARRKQVASILAPTCQADFGHVENT